VITQLLRLKQLRLKTLRPRLKPPRLWLKLLQWGTCPTILLPLYSRFCRERNVIFPFLSYSPSLKFIIKLTLWF